MRTVISGLLQNTTSQEDLVENTTSKSTHTLKNIDANTKSTTGTNYDVTIQLDVSRLTTDTATIGTNLMPHPTYISTPESSTFTTPSIEQESITEAKQAFNHQPLCTLYHDTISAFSFDVMTSARSAILHYVG